MSSDKRTFGLVHAEARRRALQCVAEAPQGYIVVVREPTRSLEQNAMLWALLEKFSQQLDWPVNGVRVQLTPEEWKEILSAAFEQEDARVAMGLNGGMVLLGRRTSKYGVRRFAEFITFIQATAAERGVRLDGGGEVVDVQAREVKERLGIAG